MVNSILENDKNNNFLLLYVPLESIAADDEEVKVSIAQYRGGRDAAISYTFDDGLLEQYTLVFRNWRKGI